MNGKTGAWGHARGGMGAITQAMASSARARGVDIRTEAEVTGALLDNGRIEGVRLASGEEFRAKAVVANCHPQILFGNIIDHDDLPEDFSRRIKSYRSESGSFRMNLALSDLPKFTSLKGSGEAPELMLNGSNNVMPSIPYVQQAYDDARAHGWARKPVIEFCIPSLLDDSLAPKGSHVMSLFCQHFRRHLPDGRSWDDAREDAADTIIDTIEEYAPGFRNLIVGRQLNCRLILNASSTWSAVISSTGRCILTSSMPCGLSPAQRITECRSRALSRRFGGTSRRWCLRIARAELRPHGHERPLDRYARHPAIPQWIEDKRFPHAMFFVCCRLKDGETGILPGADDSSIRVTFK